MGCHDAEVHVSLHMGERGRHANQHEITPKSEKIPTAVPVALSLSLLF